MSDFSLPKMLVWYVVFLFSTTFHEFLHSLVALWGGDRTAYEGGQVTLDPTPHIRREPFGLLIIPLISFFLSGWTVGWASAPYDPNWALRQPKRYALMSVAGPTGNFLLAALAFGAIKLLLRARLFEINPALSLDGLVLPVSGAPEGSPLGALAMALSILLSLNVLLGIFNLLPIPPLDGAGVLEGLLGSRVRGFFLAIRVNPGLRFLAMIVSWNVFPYVAWPILRLVWWATLSA